MEKQETNPVVATAREALDKPYTGQRDGEQDAVSSSEMEAIRAFDRKLTDGLNLVHGQFAVSRAERQEDREEFREFRRQHREDWKELKAELARVDARAEQRTKESEARIEQHLKELDTRAEQRTRESEARIEQRLKELDTQAEQQSRESEARVERRMEELDTRAERRTSESETRFDEKFRDMDARLASLEGAVRDLTAMVSKALERSSGTRRLVWGVAGALALLFAGGVIRPFIDRAVAALLGG